MKTMKQKLTQTAIAGVIAMSAMTPAKEAKAGVILAAVGSTVAMPVGLAITAMFGGFGTSVASIYYAIAHRDKSWWCYLFFMLDGDLSSQKVESLVAQRYPGLDSALVTEISNLIIEKAKTTTANDNEIKDVILTDAELAPVLNVLEVTQPELATLIQQDLTQPSAQFIK